jgi:hypothetical protein
MRRVFNHEFYRISQITRIIHFTNALKQSLKGEFY